MKVEYLEITPQMAKEFLGKSEGNPRWKDGRKIVNIQSVSRIERDIREGNWHPGNNTIAFDANGVLVDGHHRLMAIERAGITVPSVVVWGVDEAGQRHIDDGARRSDAQRIGVDTTLAAVPVVGLAFERKLGHHSPSTEEKVAWLEKHGYSHFAYNLCRTGQHSKTCEAKKGGVIHGCVCALEFGVSQYKLSRFFSVVNSGYANGPEESAAITLRNQLMMKGHSGLRGRMYHSIITQAAIWDYDHEQPRTRAYITQTPKYFDALVRMKHPLYTEVQK